MTPAQFITTLRRRWYVLAIAALCTALGMAAVHKHPVLYEACDALFVTAPPTSQTPNIYLSQLSSTAVMTGLVTRTVMSSAVQAQVRAAGFTGAYDAEMTNTGSNENPAYNEPTLQVCATSKNPDMAVRTTGAATAQFQTILHDRQAAQHVAPDSMIGVSVISSAYAEPILGRPTQALAGVAILGLVSGLALTLWSDPLLQRLQYRRRVRRSAKRAIISHS